MMDPEHAASSGEQPLRLLLLEGSERDADILIRELVQAGYVPEWDCVQAESDFQAALERSYDLILADFSLPAYDGMRALQEVRQRGLDTPFILVSGKIGEETAIEAIKQGADDYLLKDRLTRLAAAVESALSAKRIREQRRTEADSREELVRELQRLAMIAERTTNAVIITDAERRITWVNHGFSRLTGYTLDDVMGRSPGAVLQFESTDPETVAAIRTALDGGHPFRGEILNRGKLDNELWLDMDIQPMRDARGALTGFMAVASDVTLQKQVQEALHDSVEEQRALADELNSEKTRLALAQEIAKVGSWETDLTTFDITWSEETYRIFEIEPGAFRPTYNTFLELVHPDDRQLVQDAVAHSFESSDVQKLEHRIKVSHNRMKFVEECWQVFPGEDGRGLHALGTCRDITETKLAELRLAEHTRRLEFSADVARAFTEHHLLYDALHACTAAMQKHLDAGYASIWVLNEPIDGSSGPVFTVRAVTDAAGLSDHLTDQGVVDQSVIDRIAFEKSPCLLHLANNDPHLCDSAWAKRRGLRTFAGFPLLTDNRAVGVVGMFTSRPIDDDTLNSLETAAINIAQNIDRKSAEQTLASMNLELERRVESRTFELIESGRRHRTLLENLYGMAYRLSDVEEAEIEFASAGCRDLLKVEPEQLTDEGRSLYEFIYADDIGRFKASIAEAVEHQSAVNIELRVMLDDSTIKWVSNHATIVYGDDGGVEAIEGLLTDISSEKLAQQRARCQSRVFQLMAANAPLVDTLTVIVQAVEAEEMSATAAFMRIGSNEKHLEDAVAPGLPSFFNEAIIGLAIDKEGSSSKEAAWLNRRTVVEDIYTHSQWIQIATIAKKVGVRSCWSEPILSAQGEMLGIFAIFHREVCTPSETDYGRLIWASELARVAIEHEQVQVALVESEIFNRTTLDSLSAHIAVIDSGGTIVATNRAWRQFAEVNGGLFQATNEGANYLAVCDRAAEEGNEDAQATSAALRELFSGDRNSWLNEYACHSPDEQRWFLCRFSSCTINSVRHAVVAHENITSIRITQEELRLAKEQADRDSGAKSEFLANMSHELRTPLSGVLGMNQLLLATDLDAQQREYVEASNTSGKLLIQLINDILDLSKIEAGKLELDERECHLESLLYDAVEMMSHVAEQKGLQLVYRPSPEACVSIEIDDSRLMQILVNLVNNAIKFTSTGTVTVTVQRFDQAGRKATLRFAVIDTGIGIPEQRRHRLFEVFSQVDSSTTRQYGGTGLGLSICRRLVDLMNGEIGVESRVGMGSTFWFSIPVKLAGDQGSSLTDKLPAGIQFAVIADLDKVARQICECLTSWKYPFEQTATLAAGIELLTHRQNAQRFWGLAIVDCSLITNKELPTLRKLIESTGVSIVGFGNPPVGISFERLAQNGIRKVLGDSFRDSELFDAIVSILTDAGNIQLPMIDLPKTSEPPSHPLTAHILVAEDNSINQMYIVQLLKLFGCTSELATNGEEVLALLDRGQYELVLMDCQMPDMDGFAASREIRRREAEGRYKTRIPIIALTANALKGDRERCLDAGMDDYVSKPIEGDLLKSVLQKFLV